MDGSVVKEGESPDITLSNNALMGISYLQVKRLSGMANFRCIGKRKGSDGITEIERSADVSIESVGKKIS